MCVCVIIYGKKTIIILPSRNIVPRDSINGCPATQASVASEVGCALMLNLNCDAFTAVGFYGVLYDSGMKDWTWICLMYLA